MSLANYAALTLYSRCRDHGESINLQSYPTSRLPVAAEAKFPVRSQIFDSPGGRMHSAL